MRTRRDFLVKNSARFLIFLAGILTIPIPGAAQKKKKKKKMMGKKESSAKLVSLDDPAAKGLGYHHDATKTARKDPRSGVPAKKQTCATCQLYTKAGLVDGKEAGKCQVITGGLVRPGGWCNSWVKKIS